jgi:hypothetical protein
MRFQGNHSCQTANDNPPTGWVTRGIRRISYQVCWDTLRNIKES